METIKIQINYKTPITLNILSTILYDEIGEEYNLSQEDIEDYFNHYSSFMQVEKLNAQKINVVKLDNNYHNIRF